MSNFYADMQSIAAGLLSEFDQKQPGPIDPDSNGIYYIRVTPGGGSADRPNPPQETPFKMDGVARGVDAIYVDGSSVVQTDQQVTVAVNALVTPVIGGFVLVDGTRYKVIKVVSKPAAGIPVAYTIIYRK